ncbi:MAG: hypothetical protein AAF228_12830 [Pseudomonadota bacterium]
MTVIPLKQPGKDHDTSEHQQHAMLVNWFEDAEEASYDARKLAQRDRDYYDNKQLSSEQIAELKKRGQPDIVINRIKAQGAEANLEHLQAKTLETRTKAIKNLADAEDLKQFVTAVEPSQSLRST